MFTTDNPTTERISTYEVITIRQFVQKLETSQRMKRHLTSNITESINSSDSDGESITSSTDDSLVVRDLDFSETASESGDEMSDWNISTQSNPEAMIVASDVNESIHNLSDIVAITTDVDTTPEPDSTMQMTEEKDRLVLDIPTLAELGDTEEKRIAESPANPESESPMSPASEERGIEKIADSSESPVSKERGSINMPDTPEPTGFNHISSSPMSSYVGSSESTAVAVEDTLAVPAAMEIHPPGIPDTLENVIIPDESDIPVNVETLQPGSAEVPKPFVRAEEAVCPPADDSEDGEPVRVFVPEEWEAEMSERAMKKKLREVINRHQKVGGTFVTMGDVRAKLIFCPHGNIYFRPMGSFKHPEPLSTNIKIYPEL